MTDTLAEAPTVPSDPVPANSAATGAFTVQLNVELERMDVPLSGLQALSGGAVLPLDIAEGPIPVRLLVGSREIATGTLVSVGPGYGVLISGTE